MFLTTPWPLLADFMLSRVEEWVVAAIFLRNGAWHLDGVAVSVSWLMDVALVRCSGMQWYAVVRVFLEFLAIDTLEFAKAPGPARDRGGDGNGGHFVRSPCPPFTPYTRHCPFFPVQSHSTEPPATTEGGGGDTTPRQDTRRDRWLFFNSVGCCFKPGGASPRKKQLRVA